MNIMNKTLLANGREFCLVWSNPVNLTKGLPIRTLFNETSNHPKSPTVSLGIQKMAMFVQTQEPPFDDDLPTSVHTAGVDRGEVEHSLQKHKM